MTKVLISYSHEAGGHAIRAVWDVWRQAGANLDLF
jgi:hypothetical protein